MPKNKFQEIIFTILMVFVMVYAMVCYNIALNTGGMSNAVFLAAFRELPIMMPIAFILDILFQHPGKQIISMWLQTTVFNFPMALCWQLFFAGPLVRFVFGRIFREKATAPAVQPTVE